MADLYVLIDSIKDEFPDFQLKSKSSSKFMKLLHWGLLIITFGQMKTFMTKFTTTVGYTVYTPEEWQGWESPRKVVILRHERIHLRQRRDKGAFWFSLSYLLLPFPVLWAYFRMKYEMEAYAESMQAKWDLYGKRAFSSEAREATISRFTGPSYFWTWPWRKRIERWYDETLRRLEGA